MIDDCITRKILLELEKYCLHCILYDVHKI